MGRDGTGRGAVVLRHTGKVIGGAGLVWRDLDSGLKIELGYHLHRGFWGQGYATEAGAALLAHARERDVRHVISLIYVDNARSAGVARRLGMRPERVLEWAGLPHRLWATELDRPGVLGAGGAITAPSGADSSDPAAGAAARRMPPDAPADLSRAPRGR